MIRLEIFVFEVDSRQRDALHPAWQPLFLPGASIADEPPRVGEYIELLRDGDGYTGYVTNVEYYKVIRVSRVVDGTRRPSASVSQVSTARVYVERDFEGARAPPPGYLAQRAAAQATAARSEPAVVGVTDEEAALR